MPPPNRDDIVLLAMTIRGRVILPGTADYDVQIKKQHNAGFHSAKPLFFILCRDTADVQEAIKFVTNHELPISVRSGGHSVCGSSLREGTVIIDLQDVSEIKYEPSSEVVTLGPGCTIGDVNVLLMRHGRVAPIGVSPPTVCGGLILHGGIGWLTHKYGSSADNICGLKIVLADGTVKELDHGSEGQDRELYFAARGAAASVGIVTEISLRTYPMELLTGGIWMMLDDENYTNTRKLAKLARKIEFDNEKNPESRTLFGNIFFSNLPPDPLLPEELHHKPLTICMLGAWGTDKYSMNLMEQFVNCNILFGKGPSIMPFGIMNQIFAGLLLNFPSYETYWKGLLLNDSFTDEAIDACADKWAGHEPWLNPSLIGFGYGGGIQGAKHAAKINRGNEGCSKKLATYKFASFNFLYFPPGKANLDKARNLGNDIAKIMLPFEAVEYGNYVSNVKPDEEKKDETVFCSEMDRLKKIKAVVDSKNIFNRSVLQIE